MQIIERTLPDLIDEEYKEYLQDLLKIFFACPKNIWKEKTLPNEILY